jgi:hypothetical protein
LKTPNELAGADKLFEAICNIRDPCEDLKKNQMRVNKFSKCGFGAIFLYNLCSNLHNNFYLKTTFGWTQILGR